MSDLDIQDVSPFFHKLLNGEFSNQTVSYTIAGVSFDWLQLLADEIIRGTNY